MFFKFTFLWFGIYEDLVISEISTDFVTKTNALKIVTFVVYLYFYFSSQIFFF